ncbi:hypothetical protein B0H13DRAFT_2098820 [Mycena leptocephala]|nr:hypothetical protein B0H13DRAFT_2098820 [Mycena leptocephala]
MDFLWVRWLGVEPGYRAGIKKARLPTVGFVPESDPYAFGFLDPQYVIRGSHLMPDFASGRTNDLLATRNVTASRAPDDTEDWLNYHVDMYFLRTYFRFDSFVDRDMWMHYFGGGVGHVDVTTAERGEDDDDSTWKLISRLICSCSGVSGMSCRRPV